MMPIINPIWGVLFVIAGLALAVFLGIVLCKDKSKEQVGRSKEMQPGAKN
jgi:hypothetical protein